MWITDSELNLKGGSRKPNRLDYATCLIHWLDLVNLIPSCVCMMRSPENGRPATKIQYVIIWAITSDHKIVVLTLHVRYWKGQKSKCLCLQVMCKPFVNIVMKLYNKMSIIWFLVEVLVYQCVGLLCIWLVEKATLSAVKRLLFRKFWLNMVKWKYGLMLFSDEITC